MASRRIDGPDFDSEGKEVRTRRAIALRERRYRTPMSVSGRPRYSASDTTAISIESALPVFHFHSTVVFGVVAACSQTADSPAFPMMAADLPTDASYPACRPDCPNLAAGLAVPTADCRRAGDCWVDECRSMAESHLTADLVLSPPGASYPAESLADECHLTGACRSAADLAWFPTAAESRRPVCRPECRA